ncbi:hypothetical protein [Nocardia sp. NPDC024068]|uniref:hypothetical protein n=1 Tax=Nocardia sp. NPDC024068 TaxID=3157197 RepID=UPI0033D511E3
MSTERYRVPAARIGRAGATVVATAAAMLWLRCCFLVLQFRLSDDPAADPHGYGLIAGTILSVPAATVIMVCAPFAFPPHLRARVFRIVTPILLVTTVLLFVLFLFSAG